MTTQANNANADQLVHERLRLGVTANGAQSPERHPIDPPADDALLQPATNGLDLCNVAVMGGSDSELLANLDELAATRDKVFGS